MARRVGILQTYVARQAVSVVGALVVLAGAGLPWLSDITIRGEPSNVSPFHLSPKWLWASSAGFNAQPVKSIGLGLLIAVAIIVFGLTTQGRSVTIVGGVVALLAAGAFMFTISRTRFDLLDTIGFGVWLTVAGGLTSIVGGLLGPQRRRYPGY